MSFLDRQGAPIDRGLAIHFPAPHSYTGEDVLELQAHGGPIVMQLLLARCLEAAAEIEDDSGAPRLPRLRLARPGEFTERAFLNDKLDLAQAEAVADLIDASTEAAARSAARSLDGAFSREIGLLAEKIVELRLLVEATLDFPEEEIEFLERAGARRRLAEAKAQIAAVLATARQGALLNEGIRVVLAGQPNVGKSSLLNALAGAELAIVTDIPGTTRDKVGETIQIEGVPVHVTDTAGLREAGDAVEAIGVARSWSAIGDADAVVWLRDLTRIGEPGYDAGEARIVERLAAAVAAGRILEVFNKADAVAPERIVAQGPDALVVSARHRRRPRTAARGTARPGRLAGRGRGRISRPRPPCRCAAARRHPPRRGRSARERRRPGARARRRGAARGARRARRDHRHLHRRRPAGGDLQPFLYRQVSRTRPSSAGCASPRRRDL